MPSDFKVAVVATIYFPHSHADVIVSRWLEPRATDREWGWEGPKTRIASMYIVQSGDRSLKTKEFNGDDLSLPLSQKHGVPLFDSVRGALTLGGDALAVDGVLLIGEHGIYPYNEIGQKLYPRKELFDAIVEVFNESGRAVPVFCDKHLSWNPDWAQEMVETAQEMGFPLMAGSSLSHVGETPAIETASLPVEEYVGLFYCGAEVYGFHSLEWMQSLIEGRSGGEAGVIAITPYVEEAVWEAMEQGVWSKELFEAALGQARSVEAGSVQANCKRNPEFPTDPVPLAFHLEYADGVKATHIFLQGHITDFTMALRTKDGKQYAACNQTYKGNVENHFGHFATLNAAIEAMFLTGKAPIPIERTLLTTKTIALCMQALQKPGVRRETPELNIAYCPA